MKAAEEARTQRRRAQAIRRILARRDRRRPVSDKADPGCAESVAQVAVIVVDQG